MKPPDNPLEEVAPKPHKEPLVATLAPSSNELATKETPESAPIPRPDVMPPNTPLPTTKTAPPQSQPCPTTTTELRTQPDLTTEQTTVWWSKHPSRNPSRPFTQTRRREVWKQRQPHQTYLRLPHRPTDPTPPEPSILDIFDDAEWTCGFGHARPVPQSCHVLAISGDQPDKRRSG
mgnify:FL=1